MARAGIPLRLRLPNPPSSFVGRREEISRLATAIRATPLVVLWGLGGAGKTALLLQTLHTRFARAVPRTLVIALRPGGAAPEVEIARALGEASGAHIDWPGLAADPEALAAVVLDLAEAGPIAARGKRRDPWMLVLEDLHHADVAKAASFLALVGRYGRGARIVVTSRFDPALAAGVGETIALGAMEEDELATLAQRVRRLGAAEARAAARRAAGSPWRLLQDGGEEDSPGLSGALAAFLAVLAEVQVPVPRAAIATIATPPEPLDVLVRRGLLEASGGGFRVHDVVRGLLPRGAPASAARRRTGHALVVLDDPAALLEGVRILLEEGCVDAVAGALATRMDALLAGGYGPRLWSFLQARAELPLASARLRCAVDLGTEDVLVRIPEPPPDAPLADRLEWARARRLVADLAGAAEVAGRVRAEAERAGEAALAFEAGLLRVRCRIVLGDAEAVFEETKTLSPPTPEDGARLEAFVAQVLSYLGRLDEAIARASAISIDKLPLEAAVEVGCGVARVLYDGTRLSAADALLARVLARLGPSALFRHQGRVALHTRAYIAQDRGHISEARALLKRLEPMTRGAGYLRGSLHSVELTLALAFGDLDGLDDSLAAWMVDAERGGNKNYVYSAAGLRVRLATLLGYSTPAAALVPGQPPDPTIRAMGALLRLQNDARHGASQSRDAFPPPRELASNLELGVLGRLVAAEWALLSGDPAGALADARTAVEWAREAGLGLAEAEARPFLCDVLVHLGRTDEHGAATKATEALADRLPSARLAAEAAFHRALLDAEPAGLEPLAAADDPLSHLPGSRRARALLGGDDRELDAIDRTVVAAVRKRHGWDIETLAEGPPGSAWGLDERRDVVWLADGRVVSFRTRRLPFRLLLAIADRGGAATKEDLVCEVWGEREYHRLKHDNRLHLAVLKARRAIEDDPANPVRLLATPDGYALGGRVRRLRDAKTRASKAEA